MQDVLLELLAVLVDILASLSYVRDGSEHYKKLTDLLRVGQVNFFGHGVESPQQDSNLSATVPALFLHRVQSRRVVTGEKVVIVYEVISSLRSLSLMVNRFKLLACTPVSIVSGHRNAATRLHESLFVLRRSFWTPSLRMSLQRPDLSYEWLQ